MSCKPTITGDDKEFIVIAEVVNGHIGESGDNLLLGGQFGALLELEVTNGSRESKVAVDTAKVDKAAGGTDTSLLALGDISKVIQKRKGCNWTWNSDQLTLVLGLVVKREGLSAALNTEH